MPGVVAEYVRGEQQIRELGDVQPWEMQAYRTYREEAQRLGRSSTEVTRYAVEKTIEDIRADRDLEAHGELTARFRDRNRPASHDDYDIYVADRRAAQLTRNHALQNPGLSWSQLLDKHEKEAKQQEYKGMEQEQSQQRKKPASEMANAEIVKEIHESHTQFRDLTVRYESSGTPEQKKEIRQQMQPIVDRERELREEYTGRSNPEVTRDRVPSTNVGVSY